MAEVVFSIPPSQQSAQKPVEKPGEPVGLAEVPQSRYPEPEPEPEPEPAPAPIGPPAPVQGGQG